MNAKKERLNEILPALLSATVVSNYRDLHIQEGKTIPARLLHSK
jgi:hypothetical protein